MPDPQRPNRLRQRVVDVIERLRPAIQDDGGDVELVDVDAQGVVRVRLSGACIGCPSAESTLTAGIEHNLKTHVPEVTSVKRV